MEPEVLLAAFAVLSLNVYALTGGADFGGGVWDLLASGPRKEEQRHLIKTAVAPIWEANHVWIIILVVIMFACFPLAFTALVTSLHIPLTGMLIGVVLRGSAFVFKGFEHAAPREALWAGRIFEWASVMTPVLLGVCLGALTTGTMKMDLVARRMSTDFVEAWWQPFPWVVGVMCLVLFAWLAAIYLALESTGELQDDFRRRALGAGVALGAVALPALWLAQSAAPALFHGLTQRGWSLPLQTGAAACAVGALWAVWTRRFGWARVLAGGQVSLMVWGFAFAQYPHMVLPDVTVQNSAAPRAVLNAVLTALAAGGVILVPSFVVLYRVFKARAVDAVPADK